MVVVTNHVGTAPQAMGSRRHPEQTTAQVFARDLRLPSDAPLVFLPRGGVNALRPDTRAGHLVCPLEDCSDRRFVARGGPRRRDHFAHKPGAAKHGPETIAHHTAKHMVAAWLRTLYPTAEVHPDTKEVENGQRPDVLLVLPDGTQVAYEVQFAHLTVEQWQARHHGYRSQGIRDVWLFGGPRYDHSLEVGPDAGGVRMHAVFDAVLAASHPMLLIDPTTETVTWCGGDQVEALLTARGVRPPVYLHGVATVADRVICSEFLGQ